MKGGKIVTKGKKTAISIFLIAFAFGLNITGISPILGVLNEKYQVYGTSTVQLLQTLPYLFLMVGSLLVGWWTTRVSKKKIVLLGLLIIGFCGILPFFFDIVICISVKCCRICCPHQGKFPVFVPLFKVIYGGSFFPTSRYYR